jgi:hypothetical protein
MVVNTSDRSAFSMVIRNNATCYFIRFFYLIADPYMRELFRTRNSVVIMVIYMLTYWSNRSARLKINESTFDKDCFTTTR